MVRIPPLREADGAASPGRYIHSDTTLYFLSAILRTYYTEWLQIDFDVYA